MATNIFEIVLANQTKVYMQGSDDEFCKVVVIEARKFREQGKVNSQCAEILTDKISPYHLNKHRNAERAFAKSLNNPIPLATVSYRAKDNLCCFIDGATRTHFLLLNGAKYIPMLCTRERADDFQKEFSKK